ncbi:uncharacterized protein A1O9_05175 [Exophiala aquamarina CBS 119918]|uniref:Terpene synthase n=1 Tax=Exophiala aquamarina CBS 119918 TaxID=1182545 RepID=A0A072PDC8_9EURO|nr:uncharacterized protein A1O9_05175 [Exophiala aquamarina CBS 119918]KEF57258.1 hypothetical protein A1O9_05175 [Exophiala aquamarina CBS 119918]
MASRRHQLNLNPLVSDQEREHLFSIDFAYNYLPTDLHLHRAPKIKFENPFSDEIRENRRHSISLFPSSTSLPWHSGLDAARQNKHWKVNLEYTSQLLHLCAEDTSLNNSLNANGTMLADFARKELETSSYERYSRFTTYMFPEADEVRTALLAQAVLLIVIFDDTWEAVGIENIKLIQDDFIKQVQGTNPSATSHTPLQKRIWEISRDLERNGGKDIITTLTQFFQHSPPTTDFTDVREYLEYRYEDVAMPFCYACAKYSLGSDIDISNPKLKKYLHLIGAHVSIANDIGSYEKEYQDFKDGKVKHLINIVAVVGKINRTDSDAAKAACYALQLQVEQDIAVELELMERDDELTFVEWDFIDALLAMAAGNIFTSIVISRYGGEAARIGT